MGFLLISGFMATFISIITVTLAFSMAKPSCPEKCGNLSVPYPFGIGSSCSANSSFAITCKNSSVPILSSINLEVVNISVDGGLIWVKRHLSPLNCSSIQRTGSVGLSLVGSPYTIGEFNRLVVFGCQNAVSLLENEMPTFGSACINLCYRNSLVLENCSSAVCTALCDYFQSADKSCYSSTYSSCNGVCGAICGHIRSNDISCYYSTNDASCKEVCMPFCDLIDSNDSTNSCYSTDTSCNGVCNISIPRGLQELEFTYKTVGSSSSNISCGYFSLAERYWFEEVFKPDNGFPSNLSNPFNELRYTILVLEWVLLGHHNFSHHASPACYEIAIPTDYSYYGRRQYCTCDTGFEGNPYLLDGCHDIDECVVYEALASCDGYNCTNTPGSFTCAFPDAYHEDHLDKKHHRVLKTVTTVLVSVVGTLASLFLGWKYSKVLRKRIKEQHRVKFFKRNGGLLLEQHLSATGYGVEKIRLFGSKELARATDRYNENRVLGRGGQGTVYKGMLTDGRIVAVKKSKRINQGDIETFINEVVILAHINHRNIVKLLGCCLETEIPLLVYEFIPNGTLFQHIHDQNDEFPLTWEMRVRIATEVANSLSYLHSAASAPIYHRDIKSSNIMLDEKYRAKLSDFGTSRSVAIDQTHLTTRVLGTFGYLDPEYFRSSQFTEKSDVYSFGVVLVELLTGEKAVSTVRAEEGKSLAIHFLQSMEEDNLFEILDPLVLKQGPMEEILAIAQLARRCLYLNGKKRPTMKQVAMELEGIKMSKQETVFDDQHYEEEEEEGELCSNAGCSSLDTITSTASSLDVDPLSLIGAP